MCWVGNLNLKKAKANIPIFKIMKLDPDEENSVISYYFPTQYIIGKLRESNIIPDIKDPFSGLDNVDIALHSYNPLKIKVVRRLVTTKYNVLSLIYYNNNKIIDNYPSSLLIIKGYIPKEAYYCENGEGEFISDKLIMTEICVPE